MTINEQLHGFRVTRSVQLKENNAELIQMVHEETGLELIWLNRKDDNKTFAVTFTTLPENDTGVFHILEHSVLCGSEKYPVKEPFVELLKSSLNTFLNAMTFPDKTMYPVSSRNNTDFINLVRVYLDAVFKPAIYQKPEIFRQEGWHYEADQNGSIDYRGVVFNEMKGAFADADELLTNAINRALFPDTPYAYVSGGDPAAIPDLTYEDFLDCHRRFYSPSNAYIFLDGQIDLDEILRLIDSDYLRGHSNTGRIQSAPLQAPIDGGLQIVDYELGQEDSPEHKYRLAYGLVIGTFNQRKKLTACNLLANYLGGGNRSPLKRALLEEGFAEDVSLSIMDDVKQPWICLEVRGLCKADIPEAEKRIREVLITQCENLDMEKLSAELANAEFKQREKDYGTYPAGLVNALLTMGSWQYGGVPEANLEIGSLYDDLRQSACQGYFESVIREVLLDNPHHCKVILRPTEDAGQKRREHERARLVHETEGWSKEQIEAVMYQQEQLIAWQASPDMPEQLATLPHLSLSDIQDMPEQIPCEVVLESDIRLLIHRISTSGIVYASLYFNASDCSEQELSCLSLLCSMLGKLPTAKHSAEELLSISKLLCGNISFSVNSLERESAFAPDCSCTFTASFSTLEKNLPRTLNHVTEILTMTDFSCLDEIKKVVLQKRQQLFEAIVMSGTGVALNRVASRFSSASASREYTAQYEYYKYLKTCENSGHLSEISNSFQTLINRLIVTSRLTISLTGASDESISSATEQVQTLLPVGQSCMFLKLVPPLSMCSEGITIPADIGFAVRGGYFNRSTSYSGSLALAAHIIELSYLWNTIRVRGGAYGTGMVVRPTGFIACHSYRDPNCCDSLNSYLGSGGYLREYLREEPDLVGYIIGTVSEASPLMSPRTKASVSDSFYWRGVTHEDRCRRRRELLNTTVKELNTWSDVIDETLQKGICCIVGGQNQLAAFNADIIHHL